MRDGWVRRLIKAMARAVMTADRHLQHAVWGEPEARYRLEGSCNGCGKCCESPSIDAGPFTWRLMSLRVPFLWWQRVVNGFELVTTERPRRFVFRCTHYDPVTKQCDSYESRPTMCRDYPALLMVEAVPTLFDECSYRPVDKRAAVLLAALEKQGLAPEKLAEVKKKLFLE